MRRKAGDECIKPVTVHNLAPRLQGKGVQKIMVGRQAGELISGGLSRPASLALANDRLIGAVSNRDDAVGSGLLGHISGRIEASFTTIGFGVERNGALVR